jgi:hypothetical protein
LRPRDGDDLVFERLAHDFEHALGAYGGQFVEEEHAAMGQAVLARPGPPSAPPTRPACEMVW